MVGCWLEGNEEGHGSGRGSDCGNGRGVGGGLDISMGTVIIDWNLLCFLPLESAMALLGLLAGTPSRVVRARL